MPNFGNAFGPGILWNGFNCFDAALLVSVPLPLPLQNGRRQHRCSRRQKFSDIIAMIHAIGRVHNWSRARPSAADGNWTDFSMRFPVFVCFS